MACQRFKFDMLQMFTIISVLYSLEGAYLHVTVVYELMFDKENGKIQVAMPMSADILK